jgi:hypothetical protein
LFITMHDVFSYPITGAMGTVENVQSGEQRGRHVCSRASSSRPGFIGSLTLPTARTEYRKRLCRH